MIRSPIFDKIDALLDEILGEHPENGAPMDEALEMIDKAIEEVKQLKATTFLASKREVKYTVGKSIDEIKNNARLSHF